MKNHVIRLHVQENCSIMSLMSYMYEDS